MATKLPEVITEEDFIKIMSVTRKRHHKLAFGLGFFCGLRVSEVVNLKSTDIDFNRGMIFIRQSKNNKDRYVPIPKPLKQQLKYLPIGVSIRALQFAINNYSQKALGRKINFHRLRHSCGTLCLNKGMNIRQVQQLLGHSRLDTTMIYTHVNPEDLKNKIDEIWK